jgi:hypothetical protein
MKISTASAFRLSAPVSARSLRAKNVNANRLLCPSEKHYPMPE